MVFCPVRTFGRHGLKRAHAIHSSVCRAKVLVPDVPAEVQPQWDACRELLSSLPTISADQADHAIAAAFGWGPKKAYWLGSKKDEPPSVGQLEQALEYLAELGIADGEQQAQLIRKFPQVLGLPLGLMRSNVDKLTMSYRLQGPALAAALQRKPNVLGAITDCEGDCQGNCSRCFVQF